MPVNLLIIYECQMGFYYKHVSQTCQRKLYQISYLIECSKHKLLSKISFQNICSQLYQGLDLAYTIV